MDKKLLHDVTPGGKCQFVAANGPSWVSQYYDSSYKPLNFDLDRKNEITTARKSILKSVKLQQSLVAKCCKIRKI